jgi:hypothetical protein
MVSSFEFSIDLAYCTFFGINVVRFRSTNMEWSQRHILISRATKIGSLARKLIKEWIQTDRQTDRQYVTENEVSNAAPYL